MAAGVEATTREMGQSLINPDKPSVSVPGDTEKPALNPKPHLTAKPFSLQRNATVRPIRAPKTNFSGQLHRAASSETLLNTTDTRAGGLETSDSNGMKNVFDQSAAPKPVPLSPKPDLQAKPKPEPTKSPDTTGSSDQTGPNSKLDVTAEDVKNVQPKSRAKSVGFRDLNQKEQGAAGDTDPDVKVPSRCWPARNRLSADLTSKFQSPSQPDTVGRDSESSKMEKEEPPLSPSAVSESKSPVENEEAGCSIKRRISLLFDRSAAPQRRDTVNKRDITPAEISIDIKQRIQNLSLDTRLPSTGTPKSPPYEETNERSSERETEKVPVDKPPNTPEIKNSASSVENAEEEEDKEVEEDNYVAVPVYQRVRMSIDAEKKQKEEEEKQRKNEQLEKERQQQQERGRLLEEERKAKEIERQLEEERKQEEKKQRLMEERRKQEEEWKRKIEEERKEEERRRQAEKERERQQEQDRLERERQIEEEKRKTEEEKERRREEEQLRQDKLKKEREMEEETRRIQEMERQKEEERLRQEREKEERLKKEREMEEERLRVQEMERQKEEKLRKEQEMERIRKEKEMEKERLKEEERLRQEREIERIKKDKEMEEERLKEEERLRQEREKERLKKEKEMEERRRIQEIERQKEKVRLRQEREQEEQLKKEREIEEDRLKEEERLRQEREKERLKKEKEMEEERRRIQEIERQKEKVRLRQELEKEEQLKKEREIEEERLRVQEMERQKEEKLRKEREMERIRKEKEREEERQRLQEIERQKEEEKLRKEREMERIWKEKEMEEERQRLQEMERQKEEEKLRKEREMERIKKEKEMEERQRLQEMERQKEEEKRRKEREMERIKKEREIEERKRMDEEREREKERLEKEEEKLRQERENDRLKKEILGEEVPTRFGLKSFDAPEPAASQTLVSSVSAQLNQVLYDDFSVKPRRWGTGARRSSTPSPSREPEQNLQAEPKSNDPASQELRGERGNVEDLMGFEPEASSPQNSSCKHTTLSESKPEDLLVPETESDEGQLKDCEPEEDGVVEQDTENLIGETDEQSENNDDVDGLGRESRIGQALQRLTRVRQRNTSTDSVTPDVPDEEEFKALPVLESAAPLLDSSVLRSKVDLAKKRSIKRSRPTRAVRQRGALPALTEGTNPDWRFCDSTDAKDQCSNGGDSESEEEPSRDAAFSPVPCQPKRVPMFPGMNPSALMAQLKRRSGLVEAESPTEAQTPPPVLPRSPRTPAMTLGPRVLPPVDAKDSASGSSPSWLLELKSKKRMNQPESEA